MSVTDQLPSAPVNVRGRLLSSGHILVTWDPPAAHADRVDNYDVHYAIVTDSNDASTQQPGSKVQTVVSVALRSQYLKFK